MNLTELQTKRGLLVDLEKAIDLIECCYYDLSGLEQFDNRYTAVEMHLNKIHEELRNNIVNEETHMLGTLKRGLTLRN